MKNRFFVKSINQDVSIGKDISRHVRSHEY